uniref:Uncharacterized protein n=1 Tax=Romanomermis culicivorax TaxID=13658 RepID=A0A915HH21_ROMCU
MNFGYTKEFLLNLTDKEQATPLHLAVNSGDPETVRTCLQNGAKVDVIQESKATALHYACSQGSLTIVQILYDAFLEYQKQQQGITSGDETDDPDVDRNLASFLLELKDILNMTALHRAAMYDHEPVVSFLIEKGANIESVDSQKRTPLLVSAVRGGSKSFFTLIGAGVSEQVEDVINRCVLHYLVMHWCTIDAQVTAYLEKVSKSSDGRKLLNKKDHWGYTPLHMAARDDNVKFTEALIGLGVVINLKDNEDRTPLHHTAKDQSNRTPLHLATQHGYADVIQVLLSIHRNLLDIKAKKGDHPAIIALHVVQFLPQNNHR